MSRPISARTTHLPLGPDGIAVHRATVLPRSVDGIAYVTEQLGR
jgi:hypothetical protein